MAKKLDVKYWFFDYTVKDGEAEYTYDGVIETVEGEDVKEQINKRWLANFFGDETELEDGYYWDEFHERAVGLSSVREIPKSDFDVLKKYLNYIPLEVTPEKVVMI